MSVQHADDDAVIDTPTCTFNGNMTWDTSGLANTTFTAGEGVEFDTTAKGTGCTHLLVCVKYSIDAQ